MSAGFENPLCRSLSLVVLRPLVRDRVRDRVIGHGDARQAVEALYGLVLRTLRLVRVEDHGRWSMRCLEMIFGISFLSRTMAV